MKKYFVWFLCLTLALFPAGCGNKIDTTPVDTPVTNISANRDSAAEIPETDNEGGLEMSGELIKNTADLTEEAKETSFCVSMTEVTKTVCPGEVSNIQPGVVYGEVVHITYDSKTTGSVRGANVLLPAGYDDTKKYSVLYFLHGIFGDEYSILGDSNTKIKEIAGNLKNQGSIGDVIVVFPNMYANSDPNLVPGFTVEQTLPYDNFINDLTADLIPYIEENFPVKTDRENRAIIGFSMGGREALFIGISRPDLFSCIGGIAPAPGLTPGKDWAMEHPGQMSEDELVIKDTDNLPKLLMVCCGTKDSVVGKFPLSYHNIMDKNGLAHLWYEVPEADHDANAIKSGLYNFLIRWFYKG